MIVDVPETDCSVEKVVKLTFADTEVSLDGMKAISHRMAKEMEALKYRDSGIIFRKAFGILGSLAEALNYAKVADQPLIVMDFMDSYNRLPELLVVQEQNEEQSKAFLEAVDWKK